MANLDAAALLERITLIGLVSDAQLRECRSANPRLPADPAALLKLLEAKGFLTPWQSQKLLKGETDGYIIGGYRLLYVVSQGSFGRVYRAADPKTSTMVAIKVLRRRWNDNPHSVELFQREGKVGLTLRHANIVQILAVDHDETTKQHYMVMEVVEGGSLRDFLAIRKKLAAAEALRILEDCSAGLAHAYSKGMTHRDIKPTNILISSQGSAKLVDFGLAGMAAAGSGRPQLDEHGSPLREAEDDAKVERTVDYAGLEKATSVKSGDVRSDIYFLGCLAYELLTGRAPLESTKDKQARMDRRRYSAVAPLSPDEVRAPPSVFHLVGKMMAFDPQERFQTPSGLLDAVRAVRREMEGKASDVAGKTVFVVEPNEKLQEAIRAKFKEVGFRVLMSGDPDKALMRFQHQPYDAVVIDAGTTGEDGLRVFRNIMDEAERHRHLCAGVLLLNPEQAEWADRVMLKPTLAVLVRPVTLRQLYNKVQELLTAPREG